MGKVCADEAGLLLGSWVVFGGTDVWGWVFGVVVVAPFRLFPGGQFWRFDMKGGMF